MISRRNLLTMAVLFAAMRTVRAQAPTGFYDYTYKFPIAGLATALQGFVALQQAGLLPVGQIPTNMLGTPRDVNGNLAVTKPDGTTTEAWRGDPGRASSSYTDPNTGQTVMVPAAGDPTMYYIAIRATIAPAAVTVDPSTYGLIATSAAESAAVLGVWE